MANPQTENGYTRIANEILEQLVKTPLLASEFQVLLFLLRKTYGFQKKSDSISLTQFQKGTGLSRPTIIKAIKNLMARNMIVKVSLPDEGIEYTFQKDHDSWKISEAKLVKDVASKDRLTSKGGLTSTSKGGFTKTSKDPFTDPSKDPFTHKRKIKEKKESIKETTGVSFDSFWGIFPKKVGKKMAEKAWAKIQPDDKLWERIQAAIAIQSQTEQWKKNGGQFIPYPASWLNGERWNDEVERKKTDVGGTSSRFAGLGTKV